MKRAISSALLVCALALTAVASAATLKGHISLTSTSPVTVRGSGFQPDEHVVVTVMVRTAHTKAVTATAGGTFRVTLRGVSLGRCTAYFVRAKGNKGTVAVLKVVPECAPTGASPPDPGLPTDPQPKLHHK